MNNEHDNQIDRRLDALLKALPDRPVASNFTARVLRAVERGEMRKAESRKQEFQLLRFWLPRATVALLALGLGMFGYLRYDHHVSARLAKSVAAVSQVSSLPRPDVLEDFEVVLRLSRTPPADEELLALLK